MSTNAALGSFPLLKTYRAALVTAYKEYKSANGSIPATHPLLPVQLCEALKTHYTTECNPLTFIAEIRKSGSPGVCPSCGAASSATVDHVLPKSAWPAFAFFSANLIPACDQCNRKKGDAFHGISPNQRPLHPYFDNFLTQRVAIAELSPPYNAPPLRIVPVQGLPAAVLETVEWHLEHVVRKTSITATLGSRWLAMARNPTAVFEVLQYGATVEQALQKRLQVHDATFGTPNNWESMLLAGILANPDALSYLEVRAAAGTIEQNPL